MRTQVHRMYIISTRSSKLSLWSFLKKFTTKRLWPKIVDYVSCYDTEIMDHRYDTKLLDLRGLINTIYQE